VDFRVPALQLLWRWSLSARRRYGRVLSWGLDRGFRRGVVRRRGFRLLSSRGRNGREAHSHHERRLESSLHRLCL